MSIPNKLEPLIDRLEQLTKSRRGRWRTGIPGREVLMSTSSTGVRLYRFEEGELNVLDEPPRGGVVGLELLDRNGDIIETIELTMADKDFPRLDSILDDALDISDEVPKAVQQFLAETAA